MDQSNLSKEAARVLELKSSLEEVKHENLDMTPPQVSKFNSKQGRVYSFNFGKNQEISKEIVKKEIKSQGMIQKTTQKMTSEEQVENEKSENILEMVPE